MFLKLAAEENFRWFELKLSVGLVPEESLADFIDTMFVAWRKIVSSRSTGYIKNFDGILRRFFIDFDSDSGKYKPYFYLICVQTKKIIAEEELYKLNLAEEKLRISVYIKWLSSWVTALKLCTDVSVDFSVLDLEAIEAALSKFCTNEKYSLLGKIDEKKRLILKNACSGHRLVSFHGIFREMMRDRHVAVER